MNVEIRVMINEVERATNIDNCIWGEIRINDFHENLIIPLEYWNVEDYENQWVQGLKRIENHDKSCLVASVQDPLDEPFINWWLLYKESNRIVIRNSILFDHLYRNKIGNNLFTPSSCFNFIPKKSNDKVSEWIVTL
ncbi:MAG TPA: hypothetical protein VHA52_02515 [Candidatus Babeliaceae bacterium]|nr:hypothetical protein [Candidatus Babeliaceae bacterium]